MGNLNPQSRQSRSRSKILRILKTYPVYFVGVFLIILFSLIQPAFFSLNNLIVQSKQVSVIGVLAIAETFVMVGGEIDLSVGNVATLSAMVGAILLSHGQSAIVAAMAILAVGLAFGLLNGIVTAKSGVPGFLVTLGSSTVAFGLTYVASGGITVPFTDASFLSLFGPGSIFGVPIIFVWLVMISAVGYVILQKTIFGIHLLATGGNELAAKFSAIDTRKVKLKALVISGLLSGFAGILLAGRLSAGRVGALQGAELDAIAAAVVGGVSLFGGRGRIYDPLIGAFVLTVVSSGVVLLGFVLGYEWIVRGTIVIIVVLMAKYRK